MPRQYNLEDIVGQKFGKLTVLEYAGHDEGERNIYLCRCECGNYSYVRRDNLIYGQTKTCKNCSRIVQEGDHYRYYCHLNGSFIFDECDLDIISSRRWIITEGNYVRGSLDGKMEELTHVLLDVPEDSVVDHWNGDTLDNRRSNLRIVSHMQNSHNTFLQKNNTSGFKGVCYSRRAKKYMAYINFAGKRSYLGLFDTPEEAGLAHDKAARQRFGFYASYNFPREGERGCREAV